MQVFRVLNIFQYANNTLIGKDYLIRMIQIINLDTSFPAVNLLVLQKTKYKAGLSYELLFIDLFFDDVVNL